MDEMKTEKTIYDLRLHEILYGEMKWKIRYDIMRVPGGWIYQPIYRHHSGEDDYHKPVFVPLNDEFKWDYITTETETIK